MKIKAPSREASVNTYVTFKKEIALENTATLKLVCMSISPRLLMHFVCKHTNQIVDFFFLNQWNQTCKTDIRPNNIFTSPQHV